MQPGKSLQHKDRGRNETHAHKGEGHENQGAEMGVMHPQVKELLEAGRGKEGSSFSTFIWRVALPAP